MRAMSPLSAERVVESAMAVQQLAAAITARARRCCSTRCCSQMRFPIAQRVGRRRVCDLLVGQHAAPCQLSAFAIRVSEAGAAVDGRAEQQQQRRRDGCSAAAPARRRKARPAQASKFSIDHFVLRCVACTVDQRFHNQSLALIQLQKRLERLRRDRSKEIRAPHPNGPVQRTTRAHRTENDSARRPQNGKLGAPLSSQRYRSRTPMTGAVIPFSPPLS